MVSIALFRFGDGVGLGRVSDVGGDRARLQQEELRGSEMGP